MVVEAFQVATPTVTIASGQTDSSAFHFGAFAQSGIKLPSAFTGSAISFLVSADGVSYVPFYDSTNALKTLAVTQGRAYAFPIDLFPFTWIKLKSNATEGADRVIELPSKY